MKHLLLLFSLLILSITTFGQKWELKGELNIPEQTDYWRVDDLGNYYFLDGLEIDKYNSNGKLLYKQSIKNQGAIKQIEEINSLKLVLFSEEQQQLCFIDNTLTQNGNCISLNDYDFQNVSCISSANRSNLLWIYDEYNSSLVLFDYVNKIKLQSVSNLGGIIGLKTIVMLKELNSQLYLLDDASEVYIFDLFMNLRSHYKLKETPISTNDSGLITWNNSDLSNYTQFGELNRLMALPIPNIEEIKYMSNCYYMRSQNKISKFAMKRD